MTHIKNLITATFTTAAGLIIFFLAAFSAQAAPANFVNTKILTSGITQPTNFRFAPDGRIFISQITGQLLVYKNGALLPTPAISLPVTTGGDRGLISFTLDPNFATNNYIYFLYTSTADHQRISRFTMSGALS